MFDFILESGLWEAQGSVPHLGDLKICIIQEDHSPPTKRQMEILRSLQHFPIELFKEIATHARAYFRRIDAEVNLTAEGIIIADEKIESHFRYKSILIPEVRRCETNYVFVSADCDWEIEHGMQILLQDNQVIWCGDHTSLPFSSKWIEVVSAPQEMRSELLGQVLRGL